MDPPVQRARSAWPYKRYRNFFNICVLQVPSTPICGSSAFGCCGDDSSRLASCNDSKVNAAIKQYIPANIPVDFKAVVLNGSSWWNSGGMLMYWSGGNKDAPGAAMHEGSHGFHQLADEYGDCTGAQCGSNTNFTGTAGTVYAEVNSCGNPTTTDGKWIRGRASPPPIRRASWAPGRGAATSAPGSTGRRPTRR